MSQSVRARGEDVRSYILRFIDKPDISRRVADRFSISRQAANRHLQNLVDEGILLAEGKTKGRTYKLAPAVSVGFTYLIADGLDEDVVWRNDIRPFLGNLPENVLEIWHFAFTEMFNNAIDHSAGSKIDVTISKNAVESEIYIADDGIGIFRKIQEQYGLPDERQAIFELSKGKLTTDAKNHSGQGIFFTSRVVSKFQILAGGVFFSHHAEAEDDWLLERPSYENGTAVFLNVENHSSRSYRKVVRKFTVGDSYGFDKTVVPVALAKYGTDQLVSRSQAKRVLARIDQFAQVILDFAGVETIGQAFADQIFRVFPIDHPDVQLIPSNANKEIKSIIQGALRSAKPGFKAGLLHRSRD